MGHWSVELKQGSLCNFSSTRSENIPTKRTLHPSQEILAKTVFASTAQKHTDLVEIFAPLCIPECVALIYLISLVVSRFLHQVHECLLLLSAPSEGAGSCPGDEPDCRGGDCIVLGGGFFHN